jgi:hypothetical protein
MDALAEHTRQVMREYHLLDTLGHEPALQRMGRLAVFEQ